MKFKGILLDLDNTLYDYNDAHDFALIKIINYMKNNFNIEPPTFNKAFNKSRLDVKSTLQNTASSHNRLLYFQIMLEELNINPLLHALDIYELYWRSFFSKMKLSEGVVELLKKYRNKICLLTDLTAHIQYRKINRLNINKYICFVVTSEEVGIEKPDPKIFNLGIKKLQLQFHEVCMIGDNFSKDIIGASNLGIKSIWLNNNREKIRYSHNLITEVKHFKEILEMV